MVQELNADKIEELRRLRDSIISPFIAQNWEVLADYPHDRRVTLERKKTINYFALIGLLIIYIIPGLMYLTYKLLVKENKTLLY